MRAGESGSYAVAEREAAAIAKARTEGGLFVAGLELEWADAG